MRANIAANRFGFPTIQKSQQIILQVTASICFVFYSVECLSYFFNEYTNQLKNPMSLASYLRSGFYMICWIAQPIALAGIFFFEGWAVALLMIAWSLQLFSASLFIVATNGVFDQTYYRYLFQLVAGASLLHWCRKLMAGERILTILLFFAAALLAHSMYYMAKHVDRLI